jgi:hypothetical protein
MHCNKTKNSAQNKGNNFEAIKFEGEFVLQNDAFLDRTRQVNTILKTGVQGSFSPIFTGCFLLKAQSVIAVLGKSQSDMFASSKFLKKQVNTLKTI